MRAAQILVMLIGMTWPVLAADGFNIVVPNRIGVPIAINGLDASYAVVEGDWGLSRGVRPQPTVYGGRYLDPEPHVGHYYPSAGRSPGYGRLEIEPPKNRRLPQPAESFHQSYSAQSAPPAAQADIPFNPPPVIPSSPDVGSFSPQAAPGLPPGFRNQNGRNKRN